MIENAMISEATIGFSDHGELIGCIILDFGGVFQAFGTYVIFSPHTKEDIAARFISRSMEVAGAGEWKNMAGKFVRVNREAREVKSIGHILKDDWYSPREEFLAQEASV